MSTYGKSTVVQRPVHSIYDTSKLKTFVECPSKYLIEHILNWKHSGFQVHLTFGSCMHAAFEVLYKNDDFSPENVIRAMETFVDKWTDDTSDFQPYEVEHAIKNPTKAAEMFIDYAAKIGRPQAKVWKTLFIEINGSIPISDERELVVNMDTVQQNLRNEKLRILEHKSASRKSKAWLESWQYVMQPISYLWGLGTIYGFEAIESAVINGIVLRKNDHEFCQIEVQKDPLQISRYLSRVNNVIDQIEMNLDLLSDTSPDDPICNAFMPNSEACAASWGCKHGYLCQKPNLLREAFEPPIQYDINVWDPRAREATKYTIDGKEIKPKSE
jgi:hypothetical protein